MALYRLTLEGACQPPGSDLGDELVMTSAGLDLQSSSDLNQSVSV